MAQWVDIKKVRESVSIEQILDYYGLEENLVRKGEQLIGACPIHQGSNKSQFHVSTTKNIFHCFGDCRSNPSLRNGGGNLIDLVRVMEGIEEADDPEHTRAARKAALLIAEWFGIESSKSQSTARAPQAVANSPRAKPIPAELPPAVEAPPAPPINAPLPFTFKNLDEDHPYLKERGVTQDAITYFGLGFHGGKGIMKGRIVIPIMNSQGEVVAYAGRWPGSEPPEGEGKYKLPHGFHKSLEIFNLHSAKECAREHGLIVVEGYFDVIRLWQNGICHAVGLMGTSLSADQEAQLVEAVGPQGRITLMLDGDQSGRTCTTELLTRLSSHVFVKAVMLKDGIQPEHLSREEIQAYCA
jgi:DNA primase